jgi:hypothetical protein
MYLPVFLCFWLVTSTHGQTPYADFKLESNKISDIQAFEVHDGVFLTYTDNDIRRAFWIDGVGKKSQVFLNHIPDIRLCGIEKETDTTFLYYLKEENKALRLYAFQQPSQGTNVYSGGSPVDIIGRPLAMYMDDTELLVVSYLAKPDRLEITFIHRGMQMGSIEIPMPEDFSRYAASTGVMKDDELTAIPQGAATTKIYKTGGSLIITIDENRFDPEKNATSIIMIDLDTGENAQYVIPAPSMGKFTSFYHDGMLFRLTTTHHMYEWVVYDLETGVTLYDKVLNRQKSLREQKVVLRVAESKEVWYGELDRMMGQFGDPSVIVENIPGTTDLRIVTGTFQNSKGLAFSGGPSPLVILIGTLALNVVNQLEPAPGIQQYFYLKGNIERGFDFETMENIPAPSLRQTIDNYEISRTSGVPKDAEKWSWFLLYKGYLELKDGALGIYHEKRKAGRKLILLKYAKT